MQMQCNQRAHVHVHTHTPKRTHTQLLLRAPAHTHTHTHTHTCIHINKQASLVLVLCLSVSVSVSVSVCLSVCLLLLCMMYMYTHIVYRAVTKYMWTQVYRYPRPTPAESRTHAHLIGVRRIGASLQHRAHTGRGSEACTKKQERVLVVIRDVAVLRVLHEGCLHLVVAGMLNSRFALLREEGRQGVRGECLSMPNLSRAHPVCIATVVHACLLAGVHVHVCACVHM